eukprot:SAG22_NODE_5157_length_1074_cov_3.773333_1_plen_143_part_00
MNTTLTPTENHIAQTKPWKRKYQACDLVKERTIYYENPHGKAAKRLYKQYIDHGFDPEMVVPDDLQYYPLSRRFIKKSAMEQRKQSIRSVAPGWIHMNSPDPYESPWFCHDSPCCMWRAVPDEMFGDPQLNFVDPWAGIRFV